MRDRLPDNRPYAQQSGYDKRWLRIRKAVLATEPLCCHCAERGQVTLADLADHIIPLPEGNHSIDNLQPLCARCHAVKTVTERSAKG